MSGAYRMIVRTAGGPEVIEREDITIPSPGPGQLLVRNRAIGVNFIDVYHRTGLYPREMPTGLGEEAAGVVEAVGEGVKDISIGDRVAWLARCSAYATHSLIEAGQAFPLPDTLSDEVAAASLLKGLTVWMLVEKCARVQPGQTVLVHAAAGGVGSLAVQWLVERGATVIAHSGNADKAAIATRLGAQHSLHGPLDSLAAQVREITGGKGVEAVLDGVGKASWDASIASIAKRGIIVSYGNASGPVPPVPPLALSRAGSVFLTRPTLFDWIERPEDRKEGWTTLSTLLASGKVRAEIGQRYPLADAAEAHRALEARETTGTTILVP